MEFKYDQYIPKTLFANLIFRKMILEKCGKELRFRAFINKIIREDYLFFTNTFCWGENPRSVVTRMPFIVYYFQDEFFRNEWNRILSKVDPGDAAVEKTRDMGASVCVITLIYVPWLLLPKESPFRAGVVSRKETLVDGSAGSLFEKLDYLHDNIPGWMKPSKTTRVNMEFENLETKSIISGDTTNKDFFRGPRLDVFIGDEWAAIKDNDAIRGDEATSETSYIRYFISTHKGPLTQFNVKCKTAAFLYQWHWSLHEEKNKGLYTSKMDINGDYVLKILDTSYSAVVTVLRRGVRGSKKVKFPQDYPWILDGKKRSPWYDTAASRMADDKMVAQELDMDASGSDQLFFSKAVIEKKIMLEGLLPLYQGIIKDSTILENENGELSCWFNNINEAGYIDKDWLYARRFIVSCDVSFGTGASNSVAVVYDAVRKEKVARWQSPNYDPKDFARISVMISKMFNDAFLIWDATGVVGKTFSNEIEALQYSNLYYRNDTDPGFYFNDEARSTMLMNYRYSLGQDKIINRSIDGLNECMEFIIEPGPRIVHRASKLISNPTGARTAHGDEVMADAMVAHVLESEPIYVDTKTKPIIQANSVAARMIAYNKEQLGNDRDAYIMGVR